MKKKSEIELSKNTGTRLARQSVFTQEERDEVLSYKDNALAEASRRAYTSDAAHFISWCQTIKGIDYRDGGPELIAHYLVHLVKIGRKAATIARRVTSISKAYKLAGIPDPTDNEHVRDVLKGIKKTIRTRPDSKSAATVERLQKMLACVPAESLAGKRDRALLLVGFAGAFRRSELVGIKVEHLNFDDYGGVEVTIPKSKTDQVGRGRVVPVTRGDDGQCPVTALQEWLRVSEIQSGKVFRRITKDNKMVGDGLSDKTVALVVKKYAEAAGLDASRFAGHSLRSGLVTSAAEEGASLSKIQDITGHVTPDQTLRYIHDAEKFKNNAGAKVLWKRQGPGSTNNP